MLKGPRNLDSQIGAGGDHQDLYVGGGLLSWPPRSYSCGFCKREFRSAQALGGHMNVHRRDRARLRQSSPPAPMDDYPVLSLNPSPSHNPSPSPSNGNIHPPRFPSSNFSSPLPSKIAHHLHSSPSSSSVINMKSAGFKLLRSSSLRGGPNLMEGFAAVSTTSHHKQCKGFRSERNGPLNLEIGLFNELQADEIDLELRLGYS